MLERGHIAEPPERAADVHLLDLDHFWTIFLRQWRVLETSVGIFLLIGVFYVIVSPPGFLSLGQILIDENLKQVVGDPSQQTAASNAALEESDVLNQLEVLKSSRIAHAVVTAEHLDTDPAFLNPPPGPLDNLKAGLKNALHAMLPFLSKSDSTGAAAGAANAGQPTLSPADIAALQLMRNVIVERVGRSSVIQIGYQAGSPELAYRIATAYANAAVRDQLDADLDATRAAADWLQQRLTELGQSQRQASQAVERFRQESGQTVGQDKDLSTQRLNQLTQQLVLAQAQTAQARALADKVKAAIAQGVGQAGANASLLAPTTTPAGTSTVDADTTATLAHYAAVQSRLAEVEGTFGPDHPQVAVLKRERAAVLDQLFAQLKKLGDRANNDLAVAEGREAALRADVEAEGQSTAQSNQSQVKLDELQQRSAALSTLYNTFLSRYETAIQQQSFPIPSLRIISQPNMPITPSSPRTLLILAACLVLGLFVGSGFAAINEIRERSFRVGTQVTRELGLRFLGYLPKLPGRQLFGRGRGKVLTGGETHAAIKAQVLGIRPNSLATTFTETLKASKIAMQSRRHPGRGIVVGVVSALPGEGKTAYAMALAQMLAANGSKTLLIDADLRHPAASRFLVPTADEGLIDVAAGRPWRAITHADETGLAVLPAAHGASEPPAIDIFASAPVQALLQDVRTAYDFIIVDLPPLGPVVDALSLVPLIDGYVLVAEWGKTPKRLIRSLFEREPQLAEAVIGVVLNKVDFKKLPRYSDVGEAERYLGALDRYYQPSSPR